MSGSAEIIEEFNFASNGKVPFKPFEEGFVFVGTEFRKVEWKTGSLIDRGGFGHIYQAFRCKPVSNGVMDDAEYVVKVEPEHRSTSFSESQFYLDCARAPLTDYINRWKSLNNVTKLALPRFVSLSRPYRGDIPYTFLVMEKYGRSLQRVLDLSGNQLPVDYVFMVGIQLLDVLMYIHDHDWAHGDIKASNILTRSTNQKEVILIDYGNAMRFRAGSEHFKENRRPSVAHNGTLEFTSRDAHYGTPPSRRGDLEILGYCLVRWLCGHLPWGKMLADEEKVKEEKIKYMEDVDDFMRKCFPDTFDSVPVTLLTRYVKHVSQLTYSDEPDYASCKKWFTEALQSAELGSKCAANVCRTYVD